jgi:hypothetical protein
MEDGNAGAVPGQGQRDSAPGAVPRTTPGAGPPGAPGAAPAACLVLPPAAQASGTVGTRSFWNVALATCANATYHAATAQVIPT